MDGLSVGMDVCCMPGHLAVASLLAIRILKQSVVNKAYMSEHDVLLCWADWSKLKPSAEFSQVVD